MIIAFRLNYYDKVLYFPFIWNVLVSLNVAYIKTEAASIKTLKKKDIVLIKQQSINTTKESRLLLNLIIILYFIFSGV